MMARVTFRGFSLYLLATLAIAVGGCAEAPEQPPTDLSPEVGEVSSDLGLYGSNSPLEDDADSTRRDAVERPLNLDPDGQQSRPGTGFDPGATKGEPVPVPWVPHHDLANDA